MKRVDPQIKEKAVEEYLAMNSLKSVAKKYGVGIESVRRWVLDSGHNVRPKGIRYPAVEKEAKGILDPRTGEKKVTLNNRRLIRIPSEQRFNSNAIWTRKDDELIREALMSGFTVKEVSEMIGRSIGAIYNRKYELIKEGFIPRGMRFSTPRGILRKNGLGATGRGPSPAKAGATPDPGVMQGPKPAAKPGASAPPKGGARPAPKKDAAARSKDRTPKPRKAPKAPRSKKGHGLLSRLLKIFGLRRR